MKVKTGISLALSGLAFLAGAALLGGHAAPLRPPSDRTAPGQAVQEPLRRRTEPQPVRSSWDDLLAGVKTLDDWKARKEVLRRRYLDLIRDSEKPAKPPLDLVVHETVNVDGVYVRKLISYNVEADERARAYLAIPLGLKGRAPAMVTLHGTYPRGKDQEAGLVGAPEKAFLNQLARRGYVVISPDHFVAGDRTPPEGAYDTARFYEKHPRWTAVGKAAYEDSIAIDVLQSLPEVDPDRIGVVGHSLGGHGSYFLAAYDSRIKVAVSNSSGAPFRYNSKVDAWARDKWYIYLKPMRDELLKGILPPIDMHEIMALIAPRPYLDLCALNDRIAGDPPELAGMTYRQRNLMLMKVMDVYELEGAPQNFAYYTHGQGHSVPYEARQLIFGWLDKHLKGEEATRASLVKESGFAELGIAAAVTENRGVVCTKDKQGRQLAVACLLDMSTVGSLLVTDIDSGQTSQYDFPESTGSETWAVWAPYASLLSRNGRFYTFAGKSLIEFDIDRREITFCGVPAPTEFCYSGTAVADGPDGFVWAASYPNSRLVSFDPATKAMKDHGQLDAKENYPDSLAFDDAGWLYCGIGTARSNIVAFNPKTGEIRQLIKEQTRKLGSGRVYAAADGFVYGAAGDYWYRLKAGKAETIFKEKAAVPLPKGAISWGTRTGVFPDGRELVGYSLPERWLSVRDPRTGAEKRIEIQFRSGGAAISTLAPGPDGNIYGSSMHPMHFFRYDPGRQEIFDLGAIKAIGGGNICAMASQGRFVVGPSYSKGYFHLFDTTKPFQPEDKDNPNPKIIAQFEGDITRPRTCLAHPDGEHVIMAGFMGYGRTGGGIGIVDLKTGEKELLTHDQVIPYHSTHTLKALPSGDLVGGTSVLTPGGGHAKETEGVLYIMDWKTRKVVYRTVPVPGAAEVFSLEVGPDGLVYGVASGSQFFVFDPGKREVVRREDLSSCGNLVRPSLATGQDKKVYALFSKSVVRIELGTFRVEKLAESPVTISAGLAIKDGHIYFTNGAHLWRYKIPAS
jgi:outer membrane protein assembly factor BamB